MARLFGRLDQELAAAGAKGELYLVGGAVMCLVFEARESTKDLDAFFKPVRIVRQAAARMAADLGLDDDWLNDAVKGYLSTNADFNDYLELPNLRVLTASPAYLLAMKCIAMRLGEEFQDEQDVRFLLRYLNITRYEAAVEVVARYYPIERVPQKTLYALEEILG
ncbi:MAG: hypothetical protein ACSLE2_16055 [Lysobacterales bacterium]